MEQKKNRTFRIKDAKIMNNNKAAVLTTVNEPMSIPKFKKIKRERGKQMYSTLDEMEI